MNEKQAYFEHTFIFKTNHAPSGPMGSCTECETTLIENGTK